MTRKPIDFEFKVNGNKVSLTFDKKSKTTANVSYGINYADGDETYDKFDMAVNNDVYPTEAVARIFIALFDDLSFNADIKTFDDVKDHIDGVYPDFDENVRQQLSEQMAERMNIPFN